MAARLTILLISGITAALFARGQENDTAPAIPNKYLNQVAVQSGQLKQKLDKKSRKTLERWQKLEARLKKKLTSVDSAKAAAIFSSADQHYRQLEQKLQDPGKLKQYLPSLDSLHTSLKFLQQNPHFLSQTKEAIQKLKDALNKVNGLNAQFQKADEIKKFLRERRQYLKEQLAGLGFTKELKKLSKTQYYYSAQVNEYKTLLKDHKKAERKALTLLSKTRLFKDFMRRNGQLASLFRLPGNPNDPSSQANLAGLQTRVQVNNLIQQQIAAGGSNAQQQFRQNLQQAQNQLNELKTKIGGSGNGSLADMPDGFRPNSQRTKGFLQRVEVGLNIQSQKAAGYFPVTSDLGLSIGYKLNDKSIIGIGGSYKMGLGKDIRHISITHQGAGLRSFIDWKVKGNWWVSGGFEMNYRSQFNSIAALQDMSAWQQSGLIGMSKVLSLGTKFFKKTKLQLLWDFMSYQQVPKAQPIIFRIGYQF